MKLSGFVNRSLVVFMFFYITIGLYATDQQQDTTFIPHVGQEGKDVIWVPTPDELVNKMLEIAEVTEKDYLIDLGSGDGRTVIAAAKLGARALGIEYNPAMVELSNKKAKEEGVAERTKFIQSDLFECDLSEATVVSMFLLPDINMKLRSRLLKLKPGTRIVSNTFTMGDWEPDNVAMTEDNSSSWTTALMWIVPAKVEGKWKHEGGELTIRQEYQIIYGTFRSDKKTSNIIDGRLNGDVITFSYDGSTYTGHVKGAKTIIGTVTTSSAKRDWMATLIE